MLVSTVSKAALKSSRTREHTSPSSMERRTWLTTQTRAVSVEWCGLYPDWYFGSRRLSSQWLSRRRRTRRSKNLLIKLRLGSIKKARDRTFEPGDEVLALLPLPGHPLQAKYFVPYKVLEKLGPVDYVIDTPNRQKTQRVCHVNLLKPYRRRDSSMFPKQSNVVPVCLTTCSHENDFADTIHSLARC